MELRDILGTDFVELEEMLAERERRAEVQSRLLAAQDGGLLCLSLNMAGPVKRFPLLLRGYREGRRRTEAALDRAGVSWRFLEERLERAGPCAFYQVRESVPLPEVKEILCGVEDAGPLGRLLDLDLLRPDGEKISRREAGRPPRRCLLCGEEAAVCGRSRRHSVEELQRETVRLLESGFSAQWADRVAARAVRAMLYEVSVTPKPGLVDRRNSGAHRDMDFFTFLDSIAVLGPWFRRFCLLGFSSAEREDAVLFSSARSLGQEAEEAMRSATGGVNTHQGLIFSLGLLCVAAGQLYALRLPGGGEASPGAEDLCRRAAALGVHAPLPAGWEKDRSPGGARGEAAGGFSSVRRWVLPALRQAESLEEGGRRALLALLSQVEDANLLRRGGRTALEETARRARRVLAAPEGDFPKELQDFDQAMIQANLSPGGCADLLAVGYFLLFMES